MTELVSWSSASIAPSSGGGRHLGDPFALRLASKYHQGNVHRGGHQERAYAGGVLSPVRSSAQGGPEGMPHAMSVSGDRGAEAGRQGEMFPRRRR